METATYTKPDIVVRQGAYVRDHDASEWRVMVREHRFSAGWRRTFVTLEGYAQSKIVATFDTHDYAYPADALAVHLSALGNACAVAAHLESLEDWQLSAYLR